MPLASRSIRVSEVEYDFSPCRRRQVPFTACNNDADFILIKLISFVVSLSTEPITHTRAYIVQRLIHKGAWNEKSPILFTSNNKTFFFPRVPRICFRVDCSGILLKVVCETPCVMRAVVRHSDPYTTRASSTAYCVLYRVTRTRPRCAIRLFTLFGQYVRAKRGRGDLVKSHTARESDH